MQKYLLCLLINCIASVALNAQSGTNQGGEPVHKEYLQTLFQVSPRVDVVLNKNNANFYLEGLINTNGVYASIIEQTRWNIKPGIDIGLTDKWYVGASERINMNSAGVYNYTTQFYIQHRGELLGLNLLKEFAYEQFNFVDGTLNSTTVNGTSSTRRPAIGRFGIGLGLGKHVQVKENHVAVFLSYRPYIQFDYVQDGIAYFKNRFIDYTNLRMDVGYLVNKTYYIGLYASRDTNYTYVPASDPYNSNSITPIFGIACNILFYAGHDQGKSLSSFRYFYTK